MARTGPANSWEVLLAGACELFDRANGKEGRFRRRVRAARRLHRAADALRAIASEAQRRDALFQIHLSETAAECAVVRDRYGMSAPALLASLGAFDGRALAAHAVWLDDDDLELLAAHDVAVAHCPGSNGKLGSGVAPLRRAPRRAGCGSGSAPTAPPPTTTCTCGTRCAWRRSLPAPRPASPDAVSTATALRLATRGGAEALGLPVGSLEVGRPADVIRLRTDDPRFIPSLNDTELLGHLVWAGAGVSRHRRLGGRLVRGGGGTLYHRRRRACPRRGGRARPAARGLLGFSVMPGFVDQAQLHARAGDGGAGAVSWRREAHVDRGGPDGGDGGHGGDVWLVASRNESSLLGFRDHPFRRATDGGHGSGAKRHGARGKDIEVPVPVGTVRARPRRAWSSATSTATAARALVAEGGQGGRGNARFLSNRRRAPAFAEQGENGQEFWLDMELKFMADVALVGFPNAGKSTLISTVSAAKPKIADYPFTTLEPHLGVVRVGGVHDGTEFVMADIPGLVEGAAGGKGLGHQFLRHIERARVLVVLLDLGAPDAGGEAPSDQLRVLLSELGSYRPELLERPRLVVGSKADVGAGRGGVCDLVLSAATGAGVDDLVGTAGRRWSTRPGPGQRPRWPARSSCTAPRPKGSTSGAPVPAPGWSTAAPPSGRWRSRTSPTPAPRPRRCAGCAASGSTARWPVPVCARATRSRSAP